MMPRLLQKRLAPAILIAALLVIATGAAFANDRDNNHDNGRDDHGGGISTAASNVKHVFMIVLENKSFSDTFGTSTQDPYLQHTLVPMGALLTEYYGTGHVSLDNYISMI